MVPPGEVKPPPGEVPPGEVKPPPGEVPLGEVEGLVVGGGEQMEGEPLRGALADAWQPGELGDEAVDRGGEHQGS